MEVLATVIVIVVVAAGVITLAEFGSDKLAETREIRPPCADKSTLGNLRGAQYVNRRRRAIILRSGGVVRLEGRSRTKRPRLAGCKGRGRRRRINVSKVDSRT
jgi:hypothetical protein